MGSTYTGSGVFAARTQVDDTGLVTVTMTGELDALGNDVFEAFLAHTWSRWPPAVTVDLRQVGLLDTSGLASLLRASRTARSRRVPLVFLCRPGPVARLLVLGGLGERLHEVPQAMRDTNHTGAPSLRAAGRDRRPCPRRPVHRR